MKYSPQGEELIEEDIRACGEELRRYVDEGIPIAEREEPTPIYIAPIEPAKFKPLRKLLFEGRFLSVDCSSKPLLTGINYQVRAVRISYVLIEKTRGRYEITSEGHRDGIKVALGPPRKRGNYFTNIYRELESEIAVSTHRNLEAGDFCLMDGVALFGGERRFSEKLHEESKNSDVNLLMFAKISRVLRDPMGRDFLTQAVLTARGLGHRTWVYYPYRKANKHEHLYGDISCVKLSPDSPLAFRCDIADFVADDASRVVDSLSKLMSVTQDPRCIGYPSPPFLAHQAAQIPKTALADYHDQTLHKLEEMGVRSQIELEHALASFRREHLLGLRHDYDSTWGEGEWA